MAIKRPHTPLTAFSMSSMTDVIFLLLIFFMVTSTLIFPAAMEVDLPQAGEQTSLKPRVEVYLDSVGNYFFVADRNDSTGQNSIPHDITAEELDAELSRIHSEDSTQSVALYADRAVRYERVISVLEMGAKKDVKIVLATRPAE